MTHTKIIDCTLRDGLYVKHHQINIEQFSKVMQSLEYIGVEFIEIGHGLGIGGGRFGKSAPFTDANLFSLPAKLLKKSKWGTFCIAEKLIKEDYELIYSIKPDFLKLGILPNRVKILSSNFKEVFANKQNVFLFMMQSDKWEDDSIISLIEICETLNLSGIYYVDSTGCMLPKDIENFYKLVRSINSSIKLGFHAHDNLGLAVSNSIHAQNLGFEFIDTSCLGIGRSSGNCSTEQFMAIQSKLGHYVPVNLENLFRFSNDKLLEILQPNSLSSIDILTGYKSVHSFDLDNLRKENIISYIYDKYPQ